MQIKTFLKIYLYFSFLIFNQFSYAQDSGFAKSDGIDIHYRIYGQGTPIVLLSGGPGQSSDALLPIVQKLKDRFRLILIDQRGTGKSILDEIDSTTITLDHYVEDINNVRESLKINEWIVMGHSWGGGLAMALAAKYPGHTSRLILIGSLGIDISFMEYAFDNLKYSKEDRAGFEYWTDPEIRAQDPERAAYEFYRLLLPSRVYDLSTVKKIMENFRIEPNSLDIAPIMFNHLKKINYDLKPQLKNFKKPTLIIQGRQGFLGGWTAFTIFQTIPGCKIEFVEKCCHFPFIEQPEKFFEILEKML